MLCTSPLPLKPDFFTFSGGVADCMGCDCCYTNHAILKPKVTAVLIGERPGMLTAKSMSAYIAYNAGFHMSESDYNVVSNISSDGMAPVEAAAYIVDIIKAMLDQKVSGYGLKL